MLTCPVNTATAAILKQIESLGYKASEFHINDMVEMHAVLLADPDQQYVAHINDADGEGAAYGCAYTLAEMVGIDLRG